MLKKGVVNLQIMSYKIRRFVQIGQANSEKLAKKREEISINLKT